MPALITSGESAALPQPAWTPPQGRAGRAGARRRGEMLVQLATDRHRQLPALLNHAAIVPGDQPAPLRAGVS